jgi:hypothetical protein
MVDGARIIKRTDGEPIPDPRDPNAQPMPPPPSPDELVIRCRAMFRLGYRAIVGGGGHVDVGQPAEHLGVAPVLHYDFVFEGLFHGIIVGRWPRAWEDHEGAVRRGLSEVFS